VLQTLFRRKGHGVLVLTDYMPWNGNPRSAMHELHRLLEVREGSLEIEILLPTAGTRSSDIVAARIV
jgi:hypothetical protein